MLDTPASVDALRPVGWLGFAVIISDRAGGRAGAGGAECHGTAVSRCAGDRGRMPGHRGRRPQWRVTANRACLSAPLPGWRPGRPGRPLTPAAVLPAPDPRRN